MAEKQKVSFKEIMNRNLALILLIQIFSDMSLNMANSFINMGAKTAGVSVGAIGIAASIYTIAALIVRMPAGSLVNSNKKKVALIGTIAFRTVTVLFLGTFGMAGDAHFIFARAIYGIGWSMAGIVLPAVVAMMMDKKVMGTTYAILALVQSFTKEMSKAIGVKIYQGSGMIPALILASVLAVAAIILVVFLDFNDSRIKAATPKKQASGLKAINVKYIPICLILSMAVFTWTLTTQYNNVLAQERGIDLASILAVTSVVSSIVGFFASALCDIIHPKYVLILLYICLAGGTFILGDAATYGMFMLGMVLWTVGQSYPRIISIFLFKSCDPTEKGMVHATNYFMTDILSMFAGALAGGAIGVLGYSTGYKVMSMFAAATAVILLMFGTKLMNVNKERKELN